ncbi:hypothetical protein GY45DRAFT_589884 [Cubamyces sp. BRFM 1775]|nr:hypothetical protein GY45DRAFT_589884 [Cubamyces sp. BRFM 1775]
MSSTWHVQGRGRRLGRLRLCVTRARDDLTRALTSRHNGRDSYSTPRQTGKQSEGQLRLFHGRSTRSGIEARNKAVHNERLCLLTVRSREGTLEKSAKV